MLKAPCKNCPDRSLGCHDHCEKYKAYKQEHKELNDLKRKAIQSENDWYALRRHHQRKEYRQ